MPFPVLALVAAQALVFPQKLGFAQTLALLVAQALPDLHVGKGFPATPASAAGVAAEPELGPVPLSWEARILVVC